MTPSATSAELAAALLEPLGYAADMRAARCLRLTWGAPPGPLPLPGLRAFLIFGHVLGHELLRAITGSAQFGHCGSSDPVDAGYE